MSVFKVGAGYEDNYKLLVMLLVEKLGGSVNLYSSEVDAMNDSRKDLYIESSTSEDRITLEVVPK